MIEDDLWQRARVLRVYPSTPLELDTAKMLSDAADALLCLRGRIADAPHSDWCDTELNQSCDCWKAGL